MRSPRKLLAAAAGTALLVTGGAMPAMADGHGSGHPGHRSRLVTVSDALDGPRGVDAVTRGVTLVSETDGTFSLVVERRHRPAKVIKLGKVPTDFAPAVAVGRHGTVFVLTGGGAPGTGAGTLYRWRPGYKKPKPVADIAAYQAVDTDPYDLEGLPEDSNPFGVAALRDGSVLVADAAGNDLLRVRPDGSIKTVARLKPRVVAVPEGLPPTDPEGNPLPPAGTRIPAESVPTSVTVGHDGYWYVGELRGFPATPGTSEIWRIRPGSVDAVCDPAKPSYGSCTRYADGLTSVMDIAAGKHGAIYAVELSKMSWLQQELGTPGAEIGGLFRVRSFGPSYTKITELVAGKLTLPGGVAVSAAGIYVAGPVFGPGALVKIH